jgi:hypothetical protein
MTAHRGDNPREEARHPSDCSANGTPALSGRRFPHPHDKRPDAGNRKPGEEHGVRRQQTSGESSFEIMPK